MEYCVTRTDDELCHFGVKGMKWGIRRNARLLANHRRNQAVNEIKRQHKAGNITSSEKKTAIRDENLKKKAYLDKTKADVKSLKGRRNIAKVNVDIKKQTISEVPNYHLKKGLTTANRVLRGANIAGTVTSGVIGTAAVPALGSLILGSAAVAVAAQVGMHAVAQMAIDKKS